MKIKKGFILRKVGAESVAVPTGACAAGFNGMIKLNDTAASLWNFYATEHSEADGVAFLSDKYDVDRATAEKNVRAFIANVTENGFAE